MTHDIDDLLEIIKQLEERIIKLERKPFRENASTLLVDSWYWEHG